MSNVNLVKISADDDGMRFDRWLLKKYPSLSIGVVNKMLRAKQIKLDGKKAEGKTRIAEGQEVRVPNIEASEKRELPQNISKADEKKILEMVIYKDKDIIIINKPSGLAVQGGTNTTKHIDMMLDALKFENEDKPKLVHRIDKETSGILLLARNRKTAEKLTAKFKNHEIQKTYLALCVNSPAKIKGEIKTLIDDKPAKTIYKVLKTIGKFALIEAQPLSGRKHQIRIHLTSIGCPILGDDKHFYGKTREKITGFDDKLHLHAFKIELDKLSIKAKLSKHFVKSLNKLGISEDEIF
ncbi:MAG: pseudouridine synthase [Alphaproteobacteria bacterium]